MSTLANMNIEVSADIKQLLDGMARGGKSLGDFQNQLKRFQDQLKTATNPDSVLRLNRAIDASKERIAQISGAGLGAGSGLRKMSDGSNQATMALTNLSRVAQDAPFGFIGITNNINPLLESFQRLKSSTGTTKGALSALASSLMGAGGLGLAVGIGSALLTVFGGNLLSSGKSAEKSAGQLSVYQKAVKDANEEVGKSFANVARLVSLANNQNLTYKEQKEVIKQLQSVSRTYFEGLKIENGVIVGLTESYQGYIRALADAAKAKVSSGQIDKLGAELVKIQGNIDKTTEKLTAVAGRQAFNPKLAEELQGILKQTLITYEDENKIAKATGLTYRQVNELLRARGYDLSKQGELLRQIDALGLKTTQQTKDDLNVTQEKTKELRTAKDVIADLRKEVAGLQTQFKGNFISSVELDQKTIDAYQKAVNDLGEIKAPPIVIQDISLEVAPTQLREQMRKFAEFVKKDATEDPIQVPVEGTVVTTITDAQAALNVLGEQIRREIMEREASWFQIKIGPQISTEGLKEKLDIAKGLFTQWQSEVRGIIGQLRSDLVTGIGEGLGKALATGNRSDLFSGILQLLGEGVSAIGKKIVALSTLFKALQKSLKINPAAALPIGLSLIVLGSVMKNLKIPGFAEGVTNFRGGAAIVGERGPELVNLPRGSDVIPNHALGAAGAGAIQVTGVIRASGSELLVIIDRAIERRLRNG